MTREDALRALEQAARDLIKRRPGALIALNAALAALDAAESEGWRQIETAPRDGTKVDLWLPNLQMRIPNCYWHPVLGWWQTLRDRSVGYAPSHWRPLPAPPIPRGET